MTRHPARKRAAAHRPRPRKPADPLADVLSVAVINHPDAPLVAGRLSRGRDGIERVSIGCPYCGRKHRHGGYGHKGPHCGSYADTRDYEWAAGYVIVPARLIPLLRQITWETREARRQGLRPGLANRRPP